MGRWGDDKYMYNITIWYFQSESGERVSEA